MRHARIDNPVRTAVAALVNYVRFFDRPLSTDGAENRNVTLVLVVVGAVLFCIEGAWQIGLIIGR